MTGYRVRICSLAEAYGSFGALQWEYHHYLGPTFLTKGGIPTKNQPPTPAAWPHFYRWLAEHKKTCTTCLREAAEDPERELIRNKTIEEMTNGTTVFRDTEGPTKRNGA